MFEKIAVIGVGLIGGSFALSAKKNLNAKVFGVDISQNSLEKAIEIGAIEAGSKDLSELSAFDPDCVVIATPTSVALEILPKIANFISKDTVISDVCSIKSEITTAFERVFGDRFVGAHPIAGSERSGILNADEDLFKDRLVVLTPTSKTSQKALKSIDLLWQKIGAKTEIMDPHFHDFVFGALSHLPHAVCFALLSSAKSLLKNSELFKYCGPGFLDSTRIAASDPLIWRDIFLYNSENLIKGLETMISTLSSLKELIKNHSDKELLEFLSLSSNLRRSLCEHKDR